MSGTANYSLIRDSRAFYRGIDRSRLHVSLKTPGFCAATVAVVSPRPCFNQMNEPKCAHFLSFQRCPLIEQSKLCMQHHRPQGCFHPSH